MMSDVPWAVAWYGRHQCVWLTLNAQDDFFAINDYIKPVQALYFTPETMDGKFVSDLMRAGEHSWGNFIISGSAAKSNSAWVSRSATRRPASCPNACSSRTGNGGKQHNRFYADARRNRSAMPDHSGDSGGVSTTINPAPAASQRCNSA